MRLIVITLPYIVHGEAEALFELSNRGAFVHIRKPDVTADQIETLIREVVSCGADMSRFSLHYNEYMARRYGFGGVHLRLDELKDARSRGDDIMLSTSTHSWDEARIASQRADYLFLSPVFDSISKHGYKSGIDINEARAMLSTMSGRHVVALGGITLCNIASVRREGFGGAALLGSIWSMDSSAGIDIGQTVANYERCSKEWYMASFGLQFISDGDINIALAYLQGGGRWLQLRMKDTPENIIIDRGVVLLSMCMEYGATMIINDNPHLANRIGAHGVHLGRGDMLPSEAREIVGGGAIIGVTVNTYEDIVQLGGQSVDYVGLGPFRFTTTKRNLSPVLGADGYRLIMSKGIGLPVVAIGGITIEDIDEVMATGIDGIAVSGAISQAADVGVATRSFVEEIDQYR